MDQKNYDEEMRDLLEGTFREALDIGGQIYSPEKIKLMIMATNLDSLAKLFLIADSKPDEVTLDLKQVALRILGTADWIKEGLEVVGEANFNVVEE